MAFVIDRIENSEAEGGRVRSTQFFLGVSNTGAAPTTYLTTGLFLAPRDFGFLKIFSVEQLGQMTAVAGVPTSTDRTTLFVASFNPITGKFQLFEEEAVAAGGPLLEVANGINISTSAFQIRVTGV